MRFHGVWDRYELYDMANDPDEMNNLLGEYNIDARAGAVDNVVRRTAEPELREVFQDLSGKLNKLLEETGATREPNWFPPDD